MLRHAACSAAAAVEKEAGVAHRPGSGLVVVLGAASVAACSGDTQKSTGGSSMAGASGVAACDDAMCICPGGARRGDSCVIALTTPANCPLIQHLVAAMWWAESAQRDPHDGPRS